MSEALAEPGLGIQPEVRGVTRRAILLGLGVMYAEVAVITFSEPVARSSSMNISHFPVGFFMWLVAAVLFLNPLLKWMDRRYAFTSAELLTVAAIGLIGAHVPGSGLLGFFLGTLAAPYYFASPENRWGELLHPNIPSWLAPTNEGGTMQAFFEGAPDGYPIPWHAWAVPLFWWFCLIGALTFALLCIAVTLRKQWVENERLVYPLISPVADLIAGAGSPRLLPQMFRSRLFWVGFGIGFGILAWNIGSYFWPGWPQIRYQGRWWIFMTHFPRVTSRLNMYIVGFGYFANVDVLFSLWLFYLFYWMQTGVFNRIGYDLGAGTGTVSDWESAGGLFAMVVWGLWVARGHLRDVVCKALDSRCDADDSREMLSYRTAFVGFVLCSTFVVLWFHMAGMEFGVAVLLLLAMYVIYVGLARVVMESGLLYLAWTVSPQVLVRGVLGSAALTPGSVTSMAFTDGLFFHGKGMFTSGFAHGAKMADMAGDNPRRIALGMGLALLVGIPLCLYLSLKWGYGYGAYNFGGFPFRHGRDNIFPTAVSLIQNPQDLAASRLMFFGIGAVAMSVLTLLRYRLPWWPLHPIGLAVAGGGRATKSTFSLFIAWASKSLILHIGGVTLYRRFRPIFTGLLAGYSVGVGLSFAVDLIWFPGNGHWIHLY